MTSRAAVQTVHLLSGEKTLVLDTKQVPDDTILLTVVRWGEVLPKGVKPTQDHIHRLKPAYKKDQDGPATVYRMTRNEAGKFKHYWDPEKDGPRPPGKPRKSKADGGDDNDVVAALAAALSDEKKKKKPASSKKRASATPSPLVSTGDSGMDAALARLAETEATLKQLKATIGNATKKQKK